MGDMQAPKSTANQSQSFLISLSNEAETTWLFSKTQFLTKCARTRLEEVPTCRLKKKKQHHSPAQRWRQGWETSRGRHVYVIS